MSELERIANHLSMRPAGSTSTVAFMTVVVLDSFASSRIFRSYLRCYAVDDRVEAVSSWLHRQPRWFVHIIFLEGFTTGVF